MEATWSIAVGIITFLIAIILSSVYYFKYGKISIIFYIASIATYIFSVFYMWDVFNLSNNSILLLLVISTVLMFFLGKYFSKIKVTNENEKK